MSPSGHAGLVRPQKRPQALEATKLGVARPRTEELWPQIGHPAQRAWLAAYAACGRITEACRRSGIPDATLWNWRRGSVPGGQASRPTGEDLEARAAAWREAEEAARKLAGDLLEDAAWARAVEGVPRMRFSARTGEVYRRPDMCECGHAAKEHQRAPQKGRKRPLAPCGTCGCPDFLGVPYVEHEYSDRLLERLLGATHPERYAERTVSMGTLATLDLTGLPDAAIARLAAGEHPLAVLASLAEGETPALPPGRELGDGVEIGTRTGPDGGDEGS